MAERRRNEPARARPAYPASRTTDAVRTVGGRRLPDPYQWLEESTAEVRAWQVAQGDLASATVRGWQHFDRARDLVGRFDTDEHLAVPAWAGGTWFRSDVGPQGEGLVVAADTPAGDGRVVFDLGAHVPQDPPAVISWLTPSPDGAIVALGVCPDGSEHNTMMLVDVATGRVRPDAPAARLHDGYLGVTWLPDSSGFFFLALTDLDAFHQRVVRHTLGDSGDSVDQRIPGAPPTDWTLVQVSDCGRWAVAVHGVLTPAPVARLDLTGATQEWQPFVRQRGDVVAGHPLGGRYIAVTDLDAPRGRVVAIDLDAADPDDSTGWTVLVPEGRRVIRGVTPVGDALYLSGIRDSYSVVEVDDRSGAPLGGVPLPGRGGVGMQFDSHLTALVRCGHPDEYLFSFSTPVRSEGLYRHVPGADRLEVITAPQVVLEGATVQDFSVTSFDGAQVLCQAVAVPVEGDGPRPTLVFAYGASYTPLLPKFLGRTAAFVAAGGVVVEAHIRGGGELGREWWESGRGAHLLNRYRDVEAVAEHLIATGRTTPDLLAVTGASYGGLMAGMAVVQRPDLWAAAVLQVPVLDRFSGMDSGYWRFAALEDIDPDDPAQVLGLLSSSPYHLTHEDGRYPSVYLLGGDTDARCEPWHCRKFAARLQGTATEAPVLMKIWDGAGHGWGTDAGTAAAQDIEWLAFVMAELGMDPG